MDIRESARTRSLLDLLYREGRIRYYHKEFGILRVYLHSKLTRDVDAVSSCRSSKAKRTSFVRVGRLSPRMILSTSSLGFCTGKEARQAKIGGVVLGKL